MSDVVLEIKKPTRRFGAFTAVAALTRSGNAGEVFGLLGSNGAGTVREYTKPYHLPAAAAFQNSRPVRLEMTRLHPPADYTPRMMPFHAGVKIPLEESRILWHQ
jgi:hypothetical protein